MSWSVIIVIILLIIIFIMWWRLSNNTVNVQEDLNPEILNYLHSSILKEIHYTNNMNPLDYKNYMFRLIFSDLKILFKLIVVEFSYYNDNSKLLDNSYNNLVYDIIHYHMDIENSFDNFKINYINYITKFNDIRNKYEILNDKNNHNFNVPIILKYIFEYTNDILYLQKL